MRVKSQKLKIKSIAGITIIELLLIVSIIAILSVSTASFGLGFLFRNNLKNATNELVSSLRTAQINAMSGKENGKWGVDVNMTSREITLYQGDSYALRDSTWDQVFDISGSVSITEAEVVFDKITGNAGSTQTYTLSNNIGGSNTVTVNEVGVVDVN